MRKYLTIVCVSFVVDWWNWRVCLRAGRRVDTYGCLLAAMQPQSPPANSAAHLGQEGRFLARRTAAAAVAWPDVDGLDTCWRGRRRARGVTAPIAIAAMFGS